MVKSEKRNIVNFTNVPVNRQFMSADECVSVQSRIVQDSGSGDSILRKPVRFSAVDSCPRDSTFIPAIFLLVAIAKILLVNPFPTLYDAPEYVNLSQGSFIEAITLGHRPSHPGFMAIFWLGQKVAQLLAIENLYIIGGMISHLATIFTASVLYLFLRHFLSSKKSIQIVLIFLLLPLISVLSTTVAVEPVALFFLVLGFYFLYHYLREKRRSFFIFSVFSIILSTFIQPQFILWIPLFFFAPLIQKGNFRQHLLSTAKIVVISLAMASVLYGGIFFLAKQQTNETWQKFVGFANQGFSDWYNFPLGTARYLRNIIITLLRDFSPLILILALFSIIKKIRFTTKVGIAFLIFTLPYFIASTMYSADIPGRRTLPLSVGISILASLSVRSWKAYGLTILYLFLVTGPILIRSSLLSSNHPVHSLQQMQKELPSDGLYIHSHYTSPFLVYSGETFTLNKPGYREEVLIETINKSLAAEKPVFLESQAVFDPYLFYAGSSLNIFSLGQFGHSDAQKIMSRYQTKLVNVENVGKRIYVYRLLPLDKQKQVNLKAEDNFALIKGKTEAGKLVLVFSTRFFNRILQERQDYYDPFTWLWVFISGRHEPLVWTYADANGDFILPIESKHAFSVKVEGAKYYKVVTET